MLVVAMDGKALDARGLVEDCPLSTTPPASCLIQQSARHGAIRFLHLLLICVVVGPIALAIIAGYLTYQTYTTRTEGTLVQSVADAAENTVKVLDTYRLVAARIDDVLAPLSDEEIRHREQTLHEQLAQQIKDWPQIAAAWVLDASGRELVSAKTYPVDSDVTHADREDFKTLEQPGARVFIWALRARSFEQNDFHPYFTVALRRDADDGQFRGITIVSISADYLASFFNSLLNDTRTYSAAILRDNGVNLVNYPNDTATRTTFSQSDPLAQAIANGSSAGLIVPQSLFDSDGRIVAYRRVGNYPIYVSLSRAKASVLHDWLLAISGYFAIAGASILGLVLLCLLALRRTHREQAALAQATSLLRDREVAYEALNLAKEEVDTANLAKSNFLATMSNELRVPLNAIIRFSEAIVQKDFGSGGSKNYKNYVGEIHNSSIHLVRIINDILDLSQASAGKLELNETVFDLRAAIESAWQMMVGLANAGELLLHVSVSENLPLVLGDQRKIIQVLLNLIDNAIKFTPAGGRVSVFGKFDPLRGMIVTVSDTGCGIPASDLERMLRPFEEISSALNRQNQGEGLRLPLVKAIVECHNGRLELSSDPNTGTTVAIILPLERTVGRPALLQQTGSIKTL
jgi:signal transduction histidine kinase